MHSKYSTTKITNWNIDEKKRKEKTKQTEIVFYLVCLYVTRKVAEIVWAGRIANRNKQSELKMVFSTLYSCVFSFMIDFFVSFR